MKFLLYLAVIILWSLVTVAYGNSEAQTFERYAYLFVSSGIFGAALVQALWPKG